MTSKSSNTQDDHVGAPHPTPYTYTLHPTPYILHPTPYSLHPTPPYTLHPTPTPYTLRPTPYTIHPTPYTLQPRNEPAEHKRRNNDVGAVGEHVTHVLLDKLLLRVLEMRACLRV